MNQEKARLSYYSRMLLCRFYDRNKELIGSNCELNSVKTKIRRDCFASLLIIFVDLQRFELWSKQVTPRLSTCLFRQAFSRKAQETDTPTFPYLPLISHEVGRSLRAISVLLHLCTLDHGKKVLERCPARCTLQRQALIYYTSIKRQERNFLRQLMFCNPVQGLCYLSLHAYRTINPAVKTNPGPIC